MVVSLDPRDNRSNSDQDGLQDVIIIGGKDEEKKDKNRKENRFRIMPVRESRKENNNEEGRFDSFLKIFLSDPFAVSWPRQLGEYYVITIAFFN